jgi:alpha-N-arabinofuranosidase
MEMYNVHQNAKLLPITIKSNDYVLGNDKLQAVWASASKDSVGNTHISLVNIDSKKSQDITVNFDGAQFKSVTGRILTSGKLTDCNTFQQPDKLKPVAFNGANVKGSALNVKLPPFSVVVLELK